MNKHCTNGHVTTLLYFVMSHHIVDRHILSLHVFVPVVVLFKFCHRSMKIKIDHDNFLGVTCRFFFCFALVGGGGIIDLKQFKLATFNS